MTTLDHAAKARQIADEAHRVLWQTNNDRAPHLIALARIHTDLAKLTARPAIPDGTELAFHNQAGALVTVTKTQTSAGATGYPWTCHGCHAGWPDYSTRVHSKSAAAKHAAECAALQITT
ncbi:hypothetical protein ACFV27_37195 [Streptomyces antimycoticus]|uniref:hypothetical protein n=1 Tax=Streptomyces antimycoticus TaxID=68175 RepID=UPI0036CBC529